MQRAKSNVEQELGSSERCTLDVAPCTPFDLEQVQAVARECYQGLKHRMSFDRKTMARLAELAAAHPWLEE